MEMSLLSRKPILYLPSSACVCADPTNLTSPLSRVLDDMSFLLDSGGGELLLFNHHCAHIVAIGSTVGHGQWCKTALQMQYEREKERMFVIFVLNIELTIFPFYNYNDWTSHKLIERQTEKLIYSSQKVVFHLTKCPTVRTNPRGQVFMLSDL